MANFPTDNAELDAYVERFPMGSNWDGLTDVQRLQFNTATLTLWQTLDWHVSPFDNEAVRDQLNGIIRSSFETYRREGREPGGNVTGVYTGAAAVLGAV